MKKQIARAGLLVALVTILLAGCGWFSADGSLVIDIAALPDGVTAITVSVTGDGMDPVSGVFTGDPSGSEPLIIPEGTGREWTVVVDVDNSTPVTQYTADGTADIVAGEITEVTASLLISGTKLLVMDDLNERIVQIDGIGGGGWTEYDTSQSWWGMIDLEIGPDAKIYVTDWEMTSIHVLDGIADTDPTTVSGLGSLSPRHIGIDHRNDIVFFSEGSTGLYSVPLAGGTPTDYSTAIASYVTGGEVQEIKGVTVDDSGMVHLLYWVDGVMSALTLDPSGSGSVIADAAVYDVEDWSPGNENADIVAKGERIFVVLYGDDGTGPVLELNNSLVFQDTYGSLYDPQQPSQPTDVLYGPARFVGHRNPQVQFIDDNSFSGGVDQVVEIEDILGTGRTNFGETGTGVGQFEFFRIVPLITG